MLARSRDPGLPVFLLGHTQALSSPASMHSSIRLNSPDSSARASRSKCRHRTLLIRARRSITCRSARENDANTRRRYRRQRRVGNDLAGRHAANHCYGLFRDSLQNTVKSSTEFGGRVKSTFLCNLGYRDRSKLLPRSPRLEFKEECTLMWTVLAVRFAPNESREQPARCGARPAWR